MIWRHQLFHHPSTSVSRPLVVSSACLLGESVRYDGGHKLQDGIRRWLAPFVQLQALCPEVGIGLPVPRPALKLVQRAQSVRVVGVLEEAMDVTDALHHHADQQLQKIDAHWPLCAWIFKAGSPSCGHGSSAIDPGTEREILGSGAFAARVAQGAPWLPLFQEEDLLTQQQCGEMLLLSFMAQDILWQQTGTEFGAQQEHYLRLLGRQAWNGSVDDRFDLWRELSTDLTGIDNEKRRELLAQYRAVPQG